MIINGELADRARRRRLPGLDDGLQRRLRGRPDDHGAHEPRALHQPLPAGPRRDGQLPGHGPKFVNDTEHWLLLRTFVGSSSLDGQSLRRRRSTAASRARRAPLVVTGAAAGEAKIADPTLFKGPTVVEECGSPSRFDERAPPGLRRDGTLCTTTCGTRRYRGEKKIVRVGRSRSRSRRRSPRRPDAAAERADRRRRRLALSAVRSPRPASGTRVGRNVSRRRRVRVQPSAIDSPSRSSAYSYGSGRRARSPQRAWTSSRSSKRAGLR